MLPGHRGAKLRRAHEPGRQGHVSGGAEVQYPQRLGPLAGQGGPQHVFSDQPIRLAGGRPQILLCIEGAARLRDRSGQVLELRRGQSAYLSAADAGVSVAGHGTALRATVGG